MLPWLTILSSSSGLVVRSIHEAEQTFNVFSVCSTPTAVVLGVLLNRNLLLETRKKFSLCVTRSVQFSLSFFFSFSHREQKPFAELCDPWYSFITILVFNMRKCKNPRVGHLKKVFLCFCKWFQLCFHCESYPVSALFYATSPLWCLVTLIGW